MSVVTILGTLGCMAVALLAVSYTTQFMTGGAKVMTWASAFVIPLVLSAPIFYWFASKLRELAIAHYELAVVASQDSLTTCLNRGAFVTLVDAYLSQLNSPTFLSGALLVIDADNFKTINDRFGHSTGDEALIAIAAGIKSAMRPGDLVGRIGGEEFAVFLPRVDGEGATLVAERIRHRVASAGFMSRGRAVPLSISVGGVSFRGRVPFDTLFKLADDRLYAAKSTGRDRVVFAEDLLVYAAA